MLQNIISAYGLDPAEYDIAAFGSGLINHTWKLSGMENAYILQRINKSVFKSPQAIADNLVLLEKHLKDTAPGYLFAAPLPTTDAQYLVEADNEFYRLSPFIKNSHTINAIEKPEQAYEAARQFGRFSRLLDSFDASQLHYTLPNFHNLSLRFEQFQTALLHAAPDCLSEVSWEVQAVQNNVDIVITYRKLVSEKQIPLRVVHHDTKINNVLFDGDDKGMCVIDLDTVMPGFYLSDTGDMMRTYLSPANEEEQDLDKIQITTENFAAIYRGYMEEMGKVLTPMEKSLFIYSGKLMIYMQAVRFLTDFLNGDTYYQTKYPGHNLKRAQNQLTLLDRYTQLANTFKELIAQ
jgi:Ser/Thr protein kinase RdoA (MazF antagonist)